MLLNKYIKNGLLKIKVIPNSKENKIVYENKPKIYLKSVPDKNKANKELITYLKKEFKLNVMIKSGEKSRDKTLKIIG